MSADAGARGRHGPTAARRRGALLRRTDRRYPCPPLICIGAGTLSRQAAMLGRWVLRRRGLPARVAVARREAARPMRKRAPPLTTRVPSGRSLALCRMASFVMPPWQEPGARVLRRPERASDLRRGKQATEETEGGCSWPPRRPPPCLARVGWIAVVRSVPHRARRSLRTPCGHV
ncbi:hypothetical protein PVAP13_3KG003100 [Panicum virgatum]|uniref:Uncharacterized protein n=1 Tax=Panicum virgatum TaxID=38727 RepID=A0A8T0UNP7_PANVG|nr:hypothetical protein PVAP13_3KG003100 [Panicum virgatum]